VFGDDHSGTGWLSYIVSTLANESWKQTDRISRLRWLSIS
jgi:hypothetical protein